MNKRNLNYKIICLLLILAILLPSVQAAANLEVTAFSCSPNEVRINDQFICTATVQNTGDSTGTLNTATLYPDATNWLESTSYPKTVNVNINSGASTQLTFTGLKGTKTGDNGFARIMLDDFLDTFVADEGITVNVIDVAITDNPTTTSTTNSNTFDVATQAIVGGNVDVTLSFSVNSGGCSIGSQETSSSNSGLADGQTASYTWTVTMGNSNCVYTVSAQATSNPIGTATKTDSSTTTITCSDCSSGSSSSSSSSGGASVQTPIKKVESIIEKLSSGSEAKFTFNQDNIPVSAITFITLKQLLNVKLSVSLAIASEITTPITTKVYQYLKIDKTNFENSDIDGTAKVKFKVTKKWLTENNLDKSDIRLFRLDNNEWAELMTSVTSDDATSVSFTAETPGFSYFAIGNKFAVVPVVVQQTSETNETTTPEKSTGSNFWVLILFLIVVVIIILYFIIKKKKRSPKHLKW